MTVQENILLALEKKMFAFPTRPQKRRIDEILEKVSLREKWSEWAGEISFGQQKLLTLGCCIANNADLHSGIPPIGDACPATKIGIFQ